jgi:hypothetical protein
LGGELGTAKPPQNAKLKNFVGLLGCAKTNDFFWRSSAAWRFKSRLSVLNGFTRA